MHRTFVFVGFVAVVVVGLALYLRDGGAGASAEGGEAGAAAGLPEGLPRYDAWTPAIEAYAAGRLEEAREALARDAAGASGDRRAQALYFLGRCQSDLGDGAGAAATWRTLLQEHATSRYGGDALVALGRAEEAFDRYPESLGARRSALALAERYEAAGDAEGALTAWSLVLAGPGETSVQIRARRAVEDLRLQVWRGQATGADVHVVQPGDSLWKIAKRFGTTPGLLRLVNGKSSDGLRVGERLRILSGEVVLRVWKDSHVMRLFVGGVFLREYVVGLGAKGCTPVGEFRIATKQENPTWYYDGKVIPFGDPRNILGTRWLGFENKPGVTGYGIHGTAIPESIGKDESSGCVRMHDHEVEEVFELVPIGARVVIE